MPIDTGDTAFMLVSTALVMLMTVGLAFFYGGLVRRKNVLAIMMQSFAAFGVVTAVWVLVGYSFVFGDDRSGVIGSLQYAGLVGVGAAAHPRYGLTIPALVFMAFQLMFAVITPALITGAFADRMRFSRYLMFIAIWILAVYVPLAHWVWGGGDHRHPGGRGVLRGDEVPRPPEMGRLPRRVGLPRGRRDDRGPRHRGVRGPWCERAGGARVRRDRPLPQAGGCRGPRGGLRVRGHVRDPPDHEPREPDPGPGGYGGVRPRSRGARGSRVRLTAAARS